MKILVTGGAGYIGSHTTVELLAAGHDVVVFDNFSNSDPLALERVTQIAGRAPVVVQGDVRDGKALAQVFAHHTIDSVIHFAGLKSVGESLQKPMEYWDHNVTGSLRLCEAMANAGVFNMVFSSSATVYAPPASLPMCESFPLSASSTYGRTKLVVEDLLCDLAAAPGAPWRIAILRYFNPVGAHPSGLIGEAPNGIPNNLMPCITQVAAGRQQRLMVFGDDYATHDGTCVRDFIHVVDLAQGHLAALGKLISDYPDSCDGVLTVNLGTGRGYSVLEIVRAFEQTSGRPVPLAMAPRRPGDIAESYADPSRAERLLGWRAQLDLARMCEDAWRWQLMNPNGYR